MNPKEQSPSPASCSLISASRSSGSIWVKSCPSFDVAHAPQQKQQQQKQQQQVKILQHTRSAWKRREFISEYMWSVCQHLLHLPKYNTEQHECTFSRIYDNPWQTQFHMTSSSIPRLNTQLLNNWSKILFRHLLKANSLYAKTVAINLILNFHLLHTFSFWNHILSPWTSTWTWGRILWRHRYQTAPTCRAPWIHTRCRSSVCSHHWGWSWRCWSLWISQQLLGCLGFYQDDASMPVSCKRGSEGLKYAVNFEAIPPGVKGLLSSTNKDFTHPFIHWEYSSHFKYKN